MLKISKIETLGTHEGPGVRFVVFLQGCNYNCIYCHNPETLCTKGGKKISDDELIKQIISNKSYFGKKGGVTFSGGEPLLQAKKLVRIVKKLKQENIHIAIDTNGSIINEDVKELLSMVDLILLDVKQIEKKAFEGVTGSNFNIAFSVAKYLKENEKLKFWIRYVLVPNFTDKCSTIKKVGEFFSDYTNLEQVEILPYHSFGEKKYEEYKIKRKHKN